MAAKGNGKEWYGKLACLITVHRCRFYDSHLFRSNMLHFWNCCATAQVPILWAETSVTQPKGPTNTKKYWTPGLRWGSTFFGNKWLPCERVTKGPRGTPMAPSKKVSFFPSLMRKLAPQSSSANVSHSNPFSTHASFSAALPHSRCTAQQLREVQLRRKFATKFQYVFT